MIRNMTISIKTKVVVELEMMWVELASNLLKKAIKYVHTCVSMYMYTASTEHMHTSTKSLVDETVGCT